MDCIVERKNKLIEVISMNKESFLVKMYYSILGNIDIDLFIKAYKKADIYGKVFMNKYALMYLTTNELDYYIVNIREIKDSHIAFKIIDSYDSDNKVMFNSYIDSYFRSNIIDEILN